MSVFGRKVPGGPPCASCGAQTAVIRRRPHPTNKDQERRTIVCAACDATTEIDSPIDQHRD